MTNTNEKMTICANDGAKRKLINEAGSGFMINTPKGKITGHQNLGDHQNNYAEWWSFCTILLIINTLKLSEISEKIIIMTDSEIIYKTIMGNTTNTSFPNMLKFATKIITNL